MCRVEDYIKEGLANEIVDPDGGVHVNAKADRLRSAGVEHPNLRRVPPFPTEGWQDNLSCIPAFSFRTLYEHFTERSVEQVVSGPDIDRGLCLLKRLAAVQALRLAAHLQCLQTVTAAHLTRTMSP